jgi:elongation factor P
MAMLEYNEVVERKYIILEGAPYEVISSHVFRKQQRKPVNATKLKNLFSGKVAEHSFHVSEKVEEAELETKEIKYMYKTPKGEFFFSDPNDPSKRFSVTEDILGPGHRFLKPNTLLKQRIWNEKTIGFEFPISVELKVTEAPPNIKGDSSTSGGKIVTLENGTTISAPLFVNVGDVIRINTDTGEYRERVGK